MNATEITTAGRHRRAAKFASTPGCGPAHVDSPHENPEAEMPERELDGWYRGSGLRGVPNTPKCRYSSRVSMRGKPYLQSMRERARGQRRRREEGQAVIEMALILPVLLLLIAGIVKFGLVYNNHIILTDSVRVGSRQLALGRGLPDACAPAVKRLKDSAENLDTSKIVVAAPIFGGTSSCNTMFQGDASTISATYPCELTVFGIDFFPNCRLKASATEAVE